MKDKILYLILGILIGAIITASCFLIFTKNSKPDFPPDGERPNMEKMDEDGNFVRGEKRKDNPENNSVSTDNIVAENTTNE